MWVPVLLLITANIFKVSSNLSVVDNGNFSMTNNILVDTKNDSGTTHVMYGSKGTVTCDIRSTVPINIRWYYANETTGHINQIESSEKYWISPNGTELVIKKMNFDIVGKYICTAAYSQKVRIVLIVPKITGKPENRAVRGTNVVIECNVIKGLPKPKITWEYMDKSGSKFTSIPGSGNKLELSSVEDKDAGRYKCVAQNLAGKDEHITTLVIEFPPRIITQSSTVYEGQEGDIALNIPCEVVGIPQPVNTWKINGNVITTNKKYSIRSGALVIMNPIEKDSTSYTCEAQNYLGSVNATFIARVNSVPKITGKIEIRTIRGSNVIIECKIIKGSPKPKITWEFMDKSATKFSPIPSSGNKLQLSSVADKNAGRYKCVAQNVAGSDEHITTLVIESAPRIISKSSIVYEGLEGDIALRIPCEVVGIPKPVNTWKINGDVITTNKKYFIEDGALVIMNPIEKDSTSYTCEAKNYLGSVNATFIAKVHKTPESIKSSEKSRYVYLLKGETRKLQCEGYNSSTSQSVRWFIEEVEMHTGTPYIEVVKASISNDGNYTCRVSDKHGYTHTHTYVVDVGFPPKLYDENLLSDWRGDVTDILSNCDNSAKPVADVEWKFNGKVLTYQNLTEVGDSFKWGNYKCNVRNVHGSVQRSFDVQSSACLVNRKLEEIQNMPLLLTDELTWPHWETTKHNLIIEQGEKIALSCPNHNKKALNTFQKFPKQSELKAFCHEQDLFIVNNKLYKLSDLLCSNNIQPSVVRENIKCLSETSELIKVGYNTAALLNTYEVCFDHAKNLPLYTRTVMTETDGRLGAVHDWYTYPGIGNGKRNRGLSCISSNSTCCYGKTQLLSPRDFKYGSAKRSTFIDFLNAVPYWRPCKNSNQQQTTWEDIDDMSRSQLINYGEIGVWSGTHTFQEIHGAFIPRYLWKVLRFDEYDSIAIVHVNDPKPTDKDIKCKDISSTDDVNWFKFSNNYTYCCTLSDFVEAFDMRGIDFKE